MTSAPRTLYDKLWDAHVVVPESDSAPAVLYIDLHLIHEVTSPQAFTELRAAVAAPPGPQGDDGPLHADPAGRRGRHYPMPAPPPRHRSPRWHATAEHGIELFDMASDNRGIVHVIAPEQGFSRA